MKRYSGLLALLIFVNLGQLCGQDCNPVISSKVVRGTSMTGLFSAGDSITVAEGYFNCNPVERNEIVLVKWAGNEVPLLKRVVGLPGDKVRLEAIQRKFHLLVGGEKLKTTNGEAYLFDRNAARMFQVYIDSYGGSIPKETFMVLGNLPEGTMDSSHFGWVGRGMLVAKVLKST